MPENYKELLEDYVQFYRQLDEADKRLFEKRVEKVFNRCKNNWG